MSCSSRLKKLFTKEDPMHLHKTLGLLSVVHYLYRYFYVYPLTGNLGLENATAAVAVGALLHVALSTSSLIFTVIKSRLAAKPMVSDSTRVHRATITCRAGGAAHGAAAGSSVCARLWCGGGARVAVPPMSWPEGWRTWRTQQMRWSH